MSETHEISSGDGLDKLVKVMGGPQAVADRINTLRDKLDARKQRLVTIHMVNDWLRRDCPMGWQQWVLAAALDMGMGLSMTLEMCPALRPVVSMAQFIHERLEAERKFI